MLIAHFIKYMINHFNSYSETVNEDFKFVNQ